jgi:hypothetical protein
MGKPRIKLEVQFNKKRLGFIKIFTGRFTKMAVAISFPRVQLHEAVPAAHGFGSA